MFLVATATEPLLIVVCMGLEGAGKEVIETSYLGAGEMENVDKLTSSLTILFKSTKKKKFP